MPPPLLAVEEEQGNFCSPSVGHVYSNRLLLKERNYLGLTDCSLADRSSVSSLPENGKVNLNLQATELRLGLPGSQSPEREPEPCLPSSAKLDAKRLFPLLPFGNGICSYQRNVVSGSKRGFSDTMNEFLEGEGQGKHPNNSGINVILSRRPTCVQPAIKEDVPAIALQEQPATDGANLNHAGVSKSVAPVPKAQVVGWPPIKSTRTKTLATCSKNNEEIDGKPGLGPLFVKVSMDGAPYLRKVDLRIYSTYRELSSALEKMFTCFTLGQCGSQGGPLKEILSESKLKDLLHGSEYVLTYEDKDGDWMLVGDVPWDFFIETCKKLKIMKSTDAIGLAPRAVEKSKARF